jgi:type I restriction enzyme, S subunit
VVIETSSKENGDHIAVLPQGWVTSRIGDTLTIVRGISFPKESKRSTFTEGYIACLRTANVQKDVEWDDLWFIPLQYIQNEDKKVTINDILISTANSSNLVGKVSLVKSMPYPSTLGAFISLIRTPISLNPKFIYYQLASSEIQEKFRSGASTTTNISNISNKIIENIVLNISPFQEQHRIVTKIEELLTQLDAGVASLKKVQAQLKRYRQAVLKDAFEGRLTKEWRAEHKWEMEPASKLLNKINNSVKQKTRRKFDIQNPLDVNSQPNLPKEWILTQVQDVGDVQLGRQRAPEHHYGPNMRPYLRVANVFENCIDISDVKSMNFTNMEFDTYRLQYGDILLNEGQSKELVGRPAMFRNEIRDACFQNTLVRFRVYEGIIPEYALHLFLFYLQNGRFLKIASQSTNIAHLGAERFAKMSFPLAPYIEQKEILFEIDRHFSQIDHLEQTITVSLRQAESLRHSILKRAFEGKLVPQDPNDEPASILLERIKAEKARHTTETKKGKTLQPKSPRRKIKNAN